MLYALLILCAVLTGAFLYQESRKQYVSAVILKGLASACFVLTGVICSPGTQPAKLIISGLMAGWTADVLLSIRKVFREKAQQIYLAGTLIFLGGHVLYLAAIFPLSSDRPACAAVGIILTLLLMPWVFAQITVDATFRVLGAAYVGTVMLLNCFAVRSLIAAPSAFTGVFAAGAVLFLASDIILILNTFGKESRQSVRNIHICLYYAAQVLIALSLKALTK